MGGYWYHLAIWTTNWAAGLQQFRCKNVMAEGFWTDMEDGDTISDNIKFYWYEHSTILRAIGIHTATSGNDP